MQKHIISLLVIAFLSGCAAPPPQAYDDRVTQSDHLIQKKKAMEEAGWTTLGEQSATKCGASPLTPPERYRAVEISTCITRLVEEYVLPNAVFPELLVSSRAVALRLAKEYAAGKLSSAEYRKRSEERLKSYRASLIYLINERAFSSTG